MPRRKVADEVDARELIAKLHASGATLRAFARDHDIDGRSLQCWIRNLDRQPAEDARLRFVQLVADTTGEPAPAYRIRCGDVVLELDTDFRQADVAQLLAAIRAC